MLPRASSESHLRRKVSVLLRSFRSPLPCRFFKSVASIAVAAAFFIPCGAAWSQSGAGNAAPAAAAAPPEPAVAPLFSQAIPPPSLPEGTWARGRFAIATVETAPKIDGNLDEDAWRKATHAKGFYRFGSSAAVTEQTEAWICADKSFLYVAFHCLDSEPGRIRQSETQRGGDVFGDDHVSVDIDSQNRRRNFSSFAVSARGTQKEFLEGGTADNITWAGDWKAATARVKDGWVAEIAIPFALLRYPRGAQTFGLMLFRRLARETNAECWPYLPPEGQQYNLKSQYFPEFTGVALPFFAPRPVFLPYVLTSAGDGTSMREGIDIKYPLSTTLTGLATLFPDFKTIEQDVARINFSYNEQFIRDRRPFFAEGADYLPSPDLYYTPRIESVDEGIKIVGKSGNTTMGVVGSTARGTPETGRSTLAMNIGQDIGLFSRLGLNVVADNRNGRQTNRVARVYGNYGGQAGKWRYRFNGQHTQSWQDGRLQGGSDDLGFRLDGLPGMPNFRLSTSDVGPNFVSDLGFVPERNRRGWSASLGQFNRFDKGPVEFYDLDMDYDSYARHDGTGFFRDGFDVDGYIQFWSGFAINLNSERSSRLNNPGETRFRDRTDGGGFWWNQRTLFQGGGINVNAGRQEGKPYRFIGFQQGFFVSQPFSLNLRFNNQSHGPETTTQTILTGTYRLNAFQTISGRLVQQDGSGGNDQQTIGVVRGTNLYFAFSQRVRRGTDLFLLLGDPNSKSTRGQVTLKLIRPF